MMVRKNYRSVTLSEALYGQLQELARRTKRTVPKTIEMLLDNCHEILEVQP